MIDLDLRPLRRELEAAGYFVDEQHGDIVVCRHDERYSKLFRVFRDGAVYADNPIDFVCLDIIRRHISPAPTGDALRDQIVSAIDGVLDVYWVNGVSADEIADAVIAKIKGATP